MNKNHCLYVLHSDKNNQKDNVCLTSLYSFFIYIYIYIDIYRYI